VNQPVLVDDTFYVCNTGSRMRRSWRIEPRGQQLIRDRRYTINWRRLKQRETGQCVSLGWLD
jgi:hypothetical protein